MLQNPTADRSQGFNEDRIRYWAADRWNGLNRYILADPASKKKTSSDYTCFMVIGLGGDKNYYTIDMVRDRLQWICFALGVDPAELVGRLHVLDAVSGEPVLFHEVSVAGRRAASAPWIASTNPSSSRPSHAASTPPPKRPGRVIGPPWVWVAARIVAAPGRLRRARTRAHSASSRPMTSATATAVSGLMPIAAACWRM
jgi:hypothetical protein